MNSPPYHSIRPSSIQNMNRGFLPLILLVVIGISICECQNEYEDCRQPFECGSLRDVYYPFYGGNRSSTCGYPGFNLTCDNGVPLIDTSSTIYRVLDYNNQTRTVRVARNDLWATLCAPIQLNVTVDTALFNFYSAANDQEISLIYGCTAQISPPPQPPNQFNCSGNGIRGVGFYLTRDVNATGFFFSGFTCAGPQINVRINQTAAAELGANPPKISLQTSLQSGFSIQWSADDQRCESCIQSGGNCGSDRGPGSFACYNQNGTYNEFVLLLRASLFAADDSLLFHFPFTLGLMSRTLHHQTHR